MTTDFEGINIMTIYEELGLPAYGSISTRTECVELLKTVVESASTENFWEMVNGASHALASSFMPLKNWFFRAGCSGDARATLLGLQAILVGKRPPDDFQWV